MARLLLVGLLLAGLLLAGVRAAVLPAGAQALPAAAKTSSCASRYSRWCALWCALRGGEPARVSEGDSVVLSCREKSIGGARRTLDQTVTHKTKKLWSAIADHTPVPASEVCWRLKCAGASGVCRRPKCAGVRSVLASEVCWRLMCVAALAGVRSGL